MKPATYFLQLILAALFMASAAHGAEPYLISKAYWIDADQEASFDEARNAHFVPYEGAITQGYTKSALWLRLRIAGSDDGDAYALIVRQAFLSQIQLYDPLASQPGELVVPVLSGRDEEIRSGNHVGLDNGFVISTSREPRDVFLRIVTTTSLTADVSVHPLGEAQHNSIITLGILAVYFALLLGFFLWGLVNFGIRRDWLYAVFSARMAFSMAHLFVVIGLLRYVFSAQLSTPLRDLIYNLVVVMTIAVVGYFDVMALRDFGASRWLVKLVRVVLLFPLASVMLVLFGYTQEALHANAILVTIVMLLVLLLAFTTRDQKQEPYGRTAMLIVRGGYLLVTLFVLSSALMYQSLIKLNVSFLNVLFLQAVISAIIISVVLSVRARQRDLLAQQALLQVQLKEHELKAESGRRIEKERFLSMLTHELRNPLALIRLVASAESTNGRIVAKAAQEMAQVIEKVEQSDKVDDHALHVEMMPVNAGEILEELVSHFSGMKPVVLTVKGECICLADEALMRGILKNLLENAVKYSPPTSTIYVEAVEADSAGRPGVEVDVTNEIGDAGVPERDKVFSKYYRSKKARRQPGSGLGLYLISSWVELLSGKISFSMIKDENGIDRISFRLWVPRWGGRSEFS